MRLIGSRLLRKRDEFEQVRASVRAFRDFVQPNCSLHRLLLRKEQFVSIFAILI